uniref:Platelet-derived growth factor, C polypeptide n=1 Tax=Mus musculus TaxID=10090 RepID=D6RGS6_MOUSE
MLLLGLLLLTSALAGQRTGTRAESNLSSKLQLSSDKEQNGRNYTQHLDWHRKEEKEH